MHETGFLNPSKTEDIHVFSEHLNSIQSEIQNFTKHRQLVNELLHSLTFTAPHPHFLYTYYFLRQNKSQFAYYQKSSYVHHYLQLFLKC